MPTKVSVGLSKKAGLPNYGSLGASCQIEIELDATILDSNPDRFRKQITRAYAACRESVECELTRNAPDPAHVCSSNNGTAAGSDHRMSQRRKRLATPGQIETIRGMAARQGIDLEPLLEQLGVSDMSELTIVDASGLIGEMQAADEATRSA